MKNKKRKISGRKIANILITIVLILAVTGFATATYLVYDIMSKAPAKETLELVGKESTKIFDRNGVEIQKTGESRENISYDQMPQVVIDAFLSVEDSRFFKHNGFDFPRFLKSAIENVKNRRIVQGGSTLTMQLVDVAYFSTLDETKQKRSFFDKIKSKIQEIGVAIEVEKDLDKKTILTNYANLINFGSYARGIQVASKYYFGKDVTDLNLSEAAFLAGVVNAPNLYNPYYGKSKDEDGNLKFDYYEAALKRRNTVLDLMLYHGYIDEETHELARNSDLSFQLTGSKASKSDQYQGFLDLVEAEVLELTGKSMYDSGMRIYTTMDPDLQDHSNAIENGEIIKFKDDRYPHLQNGFVVMDNQNGEVLAVGAGRNYAEDKARNNRAFISRHQVGSTAKPLMDYAPSFEFLGYATRQPIKDEAIKFRGTNIDLQNYARKYFGQMDIARALAMSLNTPALRTFYAVMDKLGGYQAMKERVYDKYHFTLEEGQYFSDQFAIGGGDFTATPLELAGAYSVFMNNGNYIKPHVVRKIEFDDPNIKTIETNYALEPVWSEETAYLTSDLLYYNNTGPYSLASQSQLNIGNDFPVYSKSGTTDYGDTGLSYGIAKGAAKDSWLVAMNPRYTVATWLGYDRIHDKNSIINGELYGLKYETQITRSLLNKISNGKGIGFLQKPAGVVNINILKGHEELMLVDANIPENLVTKAYINKKFLNDVNSISKEGLKAKLENFQLSITDKSSKIMQFTMDPYKEETKLEVDGKSVLGKLMYVIDVRDEQGKTIFTKQFDQPSGSFSYKDFPKGKLTIYGYYSFENLKEGSNEKAFNFNNTATDDTKDKEDKKNKENNNQGNN